MNILVISVGSGIILGLLCAFLLRDQNLPKSLRALAIVLLVAIAGFAADWYGTSGINEGRRELHWPTVEGKVMDSRVAGERAFHAVVRYEYEVEGQVFRDSSTLHPPSFGGKNKRYDVALKTVAQYPPGKTLTVHYNPKEHDQSTIEHSVYWSYYGSTGLGVVLIGLAVCLLVLYFRS